MYIRLRGGRMTKVAGVAASFAPSLGIVASGVSSIALGAALGVAGLTVTGAGGAMAGECNPTGLPGTFICSDPANAATDTTQALNSTGDLSVTTNPGFGIDTSGMGGNAFTLSSAGDLYFNDQNTSPITGVLDGINANNAYNASPFIAGDLSITTTGNVTGGDDGIDALNDGTGDLTIEATNTDGTASVSGDVEGIVARNSNGGNLSVKADNVTGTSDDGIYARNNVIAYGNTSYLSITTTGAVTGGEDGIQARNYGKGDLTVETNTDGTASVAGYYYGMFAYNYNGGNLSVMADNVTGTYDVGIRAYNDSYSVALSITTTGDVEGGEEGIGARNYGSGDLTITSTNDMGKASVTGGYYGIYAYNSNGGNLSVTADNVTGTDYIGIYARNSYYSFALSIKTYGDVAGEYNGIEARNDGGGYLKIKSTKTNGTASVTGGDYGIYARNYFGDNLSVTADNVTGASDDGIYARNSDDSYALSITTYGDVTGGDNGIEARNDGDGDLTITSTNANGTASVTGDDEGIRARNFNGGNLSVTADNVTGGTRFDGIRARNYVTTLRNTSYLSIKTYGDVTAGDDGIEARNDGGGDLTITSTNGGAASVTGDDRGIRARNFNGGNLSVTADNVTGGTRFDGIYARNSDDSYALSIKTYGDVTAGDDGIDARNYGGGDLTIEATNTEGTASVTGAIRGIRAYNYNSGNLSVTADNVTGSTYTAINAVTDTGSLSVSVRGTAKSTESSGIFALGKGIGDTKINVTNPGDYDATAMGFNGITALHENGGSLSITADNATGTYVGIYADADVGTTTTSIVTRGTVTADTNDGIFAVHKGIGGLTIESTNDMGTAVVTGQTVGINAYNDNGGNLSVTADNVTGADYDGIYAKNDVTYYGNTSELSIKTYGNVTGGSYGINATNNGDGGLTITSTGTVYGYGGGISATNKGIGNLKVAATNSDGTATVSGYQNGIRAKNTGGGYVRIEADTVSGGAEDGIYGSNDSDGSSLTIIAHGVVTGDDTGIFARNSGTEGLTIKATNSGDGQVTAKFDGINAVNQNGGALSIEADTVRGENEDGIYAKNEAGDGGLTIKSTGTVSGGAYGIYAQDESTGDLSITANTVTGGEGKNGITANNLAGERLTITTTGTVSGGVYGLVAFNQGTGDLTINANDVSGNAGDGLEAKNQNGGALTISANTVTGADNGDGIYAGNSVGDGDLTITTTGTVSGGGDGIEALNDGSGDLTITSMNDMGSTSATGDDNGIRARNFNGGNLSVEADNVTGTNRDGISAYNGGLADDLSITTTGTVSGGDDGIEALNEGSGDLTIKSTNDMGTASVTGDDNGIRARNYNGGNLSVTADNVTGTNDDGIYALNNAGTVNLSISVSGTTTGTMTPGYAGIYAQGYGSGNTTINVTNPNGTASAIGYGGIVAIHENGGSLSITADNATGKLDGIYAYADATTTTTNIVTSGAVTSDSYGIRANHYGMGNLTIKSTNAMGTASVTGGDDGIYARNYYSGGLEIMADNVTGTSNDGINAVNGYGSMSLSVTTTGTVRGGDEGIDLVNLGTGDLTVMSMNAMGTASVTGGDKGIDASNYNGGALSITVDNATATTEEDAVYAFNNAAGSTTSLMVNGTVMGADNGVFARHLGSGLLTVSVSGMTMGVASAGINTYTGPGGMTRINVNSGANVSGGTHAILNGPGNSDVFFNDGATVSGVTALGNGSDNLTVRNADISGVTQLDGGDDMGSADGFIDILTFDGFTGLINGTLINWEEAVFDDSTASFSGASLTIPKVSLRNGTTFTPTQPGFTLNGDLAIDATSQFNLGFSGLGMTAVNGDVTNRGTISLDDSVVGDRLSVNGNLGGTGTIGLDVNLSTGTADTVQVNGNTSGSNKLSFNTQGTTTTPADIGLVTVTGTASAGDFALADPQVMTSTGDTALPLGAFAYTLEFAPGNGSFFLSPFDATGMVRFNPVSLVLEPYPAVLTNLNTLAPAFQSWYDRRSGTNGAEVGRAFFDFTPTAENAIWMSLKGNQTLYDDQSTTGADVDLGVVEFEMGMDFPVFEGANGRLIAGFSYSYQDAGADVISGAAAGSLNTTGHAVTLSTLWLADSRFYASGMVKFSQFSTDLALSGLGAIATNQSADGYAVSIEAGKAFDYTDTISLIPQVQLVHSSVTGAVASPVGGIGVAPISDGETSFARLGLHAEHSGVTGSLFGSVSLIHAFDDETTTTLAGVPFTTNPDDQRIEVSMGGERNVGESGVLYGRLTASGGLGDIGDDYSYGAALGLRVNF